MNKKTDKTLPILARAASLALAGILMLAGSLAPAGCQAAAGNGDSDSDSDSDSVSVHRAQILVSGDSRYQAVRITPQIYNLSNRGLTDLLLIGPDGEQAPYFLNSGFIETIEPVFSIEAGNRRTYIAIEDLRNLKLREITIYSDSMFKRYAEAPQSERKEIYNLFFDGESSTDTTIHLGGRISGDEIYIITIHDGDDRPIDIIGITVAYYADDLVFEGNAGEEFTLLFGRTSVRAAPVYDMIRYKDAILQGEIDRAAFIGVNFAAMGPPVAEQDFQMLFNIVIIIVVLLLGSIIIIKLKKQ